jgi:hypothetical protein
VTAGRHGDGVEIDLVIGEPIDEGLELVAVLEVVVDAPRDVGTRGRPQRVFTRGGLDLFDVGTADQRCREQC